MSKGPLSGSRVTRSIDNENELFGLIIVPSIVLCNINQREPIAGVYCRNIGYFVGFRVEKGMDFRPWWGNSERGKPCLSYSKIYSHVDLYNASFLPSRTLTVVGRVTL